MQEVCPKGTALPIIKSGDAVASGKAELPSCWLIFRFTRVIWYQILGVHGFNFYSQHYKSCQNEEIIFSTSPNSGMSSPSSSQPSSSSSDHHQPRQSSEICFPDSCPWQWPAPTKLLLPVLIDQTMENQHDQAVTANGDSTSASHGNYFCLELW